MKQNKTHKIKQVALLVFLAVIGNSMKAQTDLDGIMMNKNQLCNGLMYNYNTWDHYWEGTLKRTNQNLGTVSSQSVMYGANYGITGRLNVMISAPYVWAKSTAGTLHGSRGVQDVSLFVKWKPLLYSIGKNKISLIVVGGFSTPVTNYQVDYLPLTIGLGSTNITSRAMAEFQHKRFTVNGSATYIWRSNVKIDRTSYFDTRMHLTNEVKMPDVSQYQLRTGYRGRYLLAEALLTNWTTLGGFDITRNNMPFPSNRMNMTTVGAAFKYTLKQYTHLSLLAGANYTVAGRNVGEATAFNAGVFYAFYLNKASNQMLKTKSILK
jgi:Putative MetA-pathway of phenol degradation